MLRFRKLLAALPLVVAALTLSMPVEGLAAGKTLVVARGADSNSLDPAESQSFEAIKVADWSFDGLTRLKGNTSDVEPALATDWTVDETGLIWTFNLRKGVKFHDGTDFNADAVVFSFERQRDPDHPFHNNFFRRWNSKFGQVKITEKIDDYTVRVTLNKPAPTLLKNMTAYIGYIVSPTAVRNDPEGFRNNPVGTGYFKFVGRIKDDYIEYEANNDYWDGPPKLDRLIVRVIPDNEVRLLALKKGEVQLIYGVPALQLKSLKADPDLQVLLADTMGTNWIAMNMEQKPFDDIRVRKAIQLAINRKRLFQTVFFGVGQQANQFMSELWMGNNESIVPPEYNPEKAKALLAEAGYPDGFKTTLISWTNPRPYNPSPRDTVALIKTDLKRIGVEVNIELMNWSTFRATRGKGEYGMTNAGWISAGLDPDGMVYPLLHSSYIREIDSSNWTRLRDEEMDKNLEIARGSYDFDIRDAAYQKVAAQYDDAAGAVFIAHPVIAMAARKNLTDVFLHASTTVPLHDVDLK